MNQFSRFKPQRPQNLIWGGYEFPQRLQTRSTDGGIECGIEGEIDGG